MKVDLILLTKNDMATLPETLHSITFIDKINHVVLIDGGSKDGTIEFVANWARNHGLNLRVLRNVKGRARARVVGLKEARTEWVVMLDSDVILAPNWFEEVSKHVGHDVGAIWAVEDPRGDPYRTVYDVMTVYYQLDRYNLSYYSDRYYTHALLIRREPALKIMLEPKYHEFHVMEDHFLGLKMTNMGYKWIKCMTTSFIHNSRQRRWTKELWLAGYNGTLLRYYNIRKVVKGLLLGPLKSMIMMLSGRVKIGLWNYYGYIVLALGFFLAKLKLALGMERLIA
jgi:glycosyltransferase involved in cell wall biosynthesis